MKFGSRMLLPLALLTLVCTTRAVASQVVVDFEDSTVNRSTIADGYGGITWSGQFRTYSENVNPYLPHSGRWSAYYGNFTFPPSAGEAVIGFASGVLFDGAWFAGGPPFSNANLAVKLYYQGSLVFSTSAVSLSNSPQLLGTGYSGLVDRVGFVSNAQGYYVVDDIAYRTVATPEPSTAVAALIGAFVVACRLRRGRSPA